MKYDWPPICTQVRLVYFNAILQGRFPGVYFLPIRGSEITSGINTTAWQQYNALRLTSVYGILACLDFFFGLLSFSMAYAETPRTDAGNATLMTNGRDLENFSIENSLLSPLKRKNTREDLLSQMRNGRGSLKTPKARFPLADRKNLPSLPARQEFTPLLQSVTKKNFERKGRLSGQPDTPAFLKGSLRHSDSPALPGTEISVLYGSELGSSVMVDNDRAPMPQMAGSSEQSTPLAVLPKRDGNGVLTDQGNLMTLREQENVCGSASFSLLQD